MYRRSCHQRCWRSRFPYTCVVSDGIVRIEVGNLCALRFRSPRGACRWHNGWRLLDKDHVVRAANLT